MAMSSIYDESESLIHGYLKENSNNNIPFGVMDIIILFYDNKRVFIDALVIKVEDEPPKIITPNACKPNDIAFELKLLSKYSMGIMFTVKRKRVIGLKKIITLQKGNIILDEYL